MIKKLFSLAAALALVATLAASPEPKGKVDLNTADSKQLQTLPGIGPALAERIIAFRKENGRFKRIEGLMNVRGIGEKKFEQLKDRISVGAPPAPPPPPKSGKPN